MDVHIQLIKQVIVDSILFWTNYTNTTEQEILLCTVVSTFAHCRDSRVKHETLLRLVVVTLYNFLYAQTQQHIF